MIIQLIKSRKDLIAYILFGACTTIVNGATYFICADILSLSTVLSTAIAWIIAVLFAFVTNRKWVFKSIKKTPTGIIREIIYFFSCRITTGLIDIFLMYIFVDRFLLNGMLIKILSNLLIIILNYIASKYLVFTN